MKPELSEKNPYYIPKHRYYELYHFCLQYPTWTKAYAALEGLAKRPTDLEKVKSSGISNPTAETAESAIWFANRISIVHQAIREVDSDGKLFNFLLYNVTLQLSYDAMDVQWGMPVSKDEFYKKRREFFWRLSKTRE